MTLLVRCKNKTWGDFVHGESASGRIHRLPLAPMVIMVRRKDSLQACLICYTGVHYCIFALQSNILLKLCILTICLQIKFFVRKETKQKIFIFYPLRTIEIYFYLVMALS